MKKILASSILTLTVSLMSVTSTAYANTFPDVNNSTTLYEEGIEFLTSKNILHGYPDGNFLPIESLNRAEMIKIVVEAKIISDGSNPNVLDSFADDYCFVDVPDQEWYTKYICYAKSQGWVKGYGEGLRKFYHPSEPVNFVEGLKMMMETFDINYPNWAGPWYEGIVKGASKKNYIPFTIKAFDSSLHRDEMADMIARILKDKEGLLNEYLAERSTIIVTFENILMGKDSSQKKKVVDKELLNGDVKWVGKTTPLVDGGDSSNYELWRIDKSQKELLVGEFYLSNHCYTVDWILKAGGVELQYSKSPCVDFAELTNIFYDSLGRERFRLYQDSSKAYEFSFQNLEAPEYKATLITEGKCEGQISNSIEDPVMPKVLLKGLKLTSTEGEEEYLFNKVEEIECRNYDGYIINPAITVEIIDQETIQFTLPNSQKGTISLDSENDPRVVFE